MRLPSRALRWSSALLAACVLPAAHAQNLPQPAAPAPAALPVSQGEVDIACDAFGMGDLVRPGEWAGVRLRLTDHASKPRAVAVCFWQPDPDGDTALVTRELTLNPGVAQTLWLYTPLTWQTTTSTVFTITVHALGADSAAPADQLAEGATGPVSLGRQIASTRISPKRIVHDADSLIAALGRSPAGGLVRYSLTLDASDPRPLAANELTEVVTGLTSADLPDRWMGLAQYESLVWLTGDPGTLSNFQADALREWVQRGGHLIVSLPSVGQTWTNPRSNPLQSLLPRVTISSEEGADLEPLRPLLRPRDSLPLPDKGVIHTLSPDPNAAPGEAVVLLAAPSGRPIVARRALGAGLVTLIGLDFAQQNLAERVDAQFFWHRITGKRFDVLSREQMGAARKAHWLDGQPIWIDSEIAAEIAKSGRAAGGVLLALGVFGAYLLLAGPLGFAMLRRRSIERHAWLAFVIVAGAFTVLAWGGATAMRPLHAEIQHLTVLDHVYGQPTERARAWFSALLPTYGEQSVSISNPDQSAGAHNALRPWDSPTGAANARFPDARPYALDARGPDTLAVPTRSTVKSFQADWIGGPAWSGIAPDSAGVRIEVKGEQTRLVGNLSHNYPAPLKDVRFILVRKQKQLRGDLGEGGPLLSEVSAWASAVNWPANETINLADYLAPASATPGAPSQSEGAAYLDALTKPFTGSTASQFAGGELRSNASPYARLLAISFYAALQQPRYLDKGDNQLNAAGIPARRAAHSLDLSPWLDQPCLIILGQIDSGPSPIPLRIDGREVPTTGRTMIRWIYPLASNPPAAPR